MNKIFLKLTEVLDHLPAIVFQLDEHGNILYINRAGIETTGYTPEQLTGKPASALITPASSNEKESDTNALNIDLFLTEKKRWTLLTSDGIRIPVYISASPLSIDGKPAGLAGIIIDIREQLKLEKKLIKSEERMRRLTDMAMEGIIFHNNGMILDCNRTFCEMTGCGKDELINRDITDFIPEKCDNQSFQIMDSNEAVIPCETKLFKPDGRSIDIELTSKEIVFEGEPLSAVLIQDISHKKMIEYLHDHDELTGLYNLRGITRQLTRLIYSDRPSERSIAVMTIKYDKDQYNVIKDIDPDLEKVLLKSVPIEVSERLKQLLFKDDIMGRTSENEFITIHPLPENYNQSDSVTLIKKVIDIFSSEFANGIALKPCVGITFYPEDYPEKNPSKVINHSRYASEEALLKPGRYAFYNENTHRETREKIEFIKDLIIAVKEEKCRNFILYYQPKVDASMRIQGTESLIRWKNPKWGNSENGLVAPDRFIQTAEEIGIISEIGEWVIKEACRQTKKWHEMDKRLSHLQIAVNISPSQLTEKLPLYLNKVLTETGLPPEALELEITERESIKEKNTEILHKLKEQNISLAIDDFGIEYSSLSCLPKLPVNTIKLDKSYIDNISTDRDYENLVNLTIQMVHGLNFSVIAEGVELAEQVEILFGPMNCDNIQGFFFYKPMTADEIEIVLKKNIL